jgi:hypothetical protein
MRVEKRLQRRARSARALVFLLPKGQWLVYTLHVRYLSTLPILLQIELSESLAGDSSAFWLSNATARDALGATPKLCGLLLELTRRRAHAVSKLTAPHWSRSEQWKATNLFCA